MKLLVYLPALNEGKGISKVIDSIPKSFKGVTDVDVLVVDDGSTDDTAVRAKERGAYVVSHIAQKHVGMAFRTAIEFVREGNYDILVSIDADRQFNPKEIGNVIDPILKGSADIVAGNRFKNGIPENMSKLKYWGNGMMARLISFISGQKFRDVSCGFRAYSRKAIENLNLYGKFTYTQESILDMSFKGLRIVEVPVSVRYFKGRTSRVAKSIVKYAFKTSYIILSFLVIYKPILILTLILLFFILLNILFYSFSTTVLFTISIIVCSILYMCIFFVVLFKNIRRIINNQERILSKIERGRHE